MQMTPVQSSVVSAIGYDPEKCLLRVSLLNGSTLEYPGTSALDYALFMAAPSKGSHLHKNIRRRGETVATESTQQNKASETFGEDPCCSRRLMRAQRPSDVWECPKCGCTWRARMVGTLKSWTPDEPPVMVFNS